MQKVKKSRKFAKVDSRRIPESRYLLADFKDDLLQEIRELLYDRYWLSASEADAVHRSCGIISCFAESGGRAATFLRGRCTA